jgi:hypothetical protein
MDKEYIRGHRDGWLISHKKTTRDWHDLIEKAVETKVISNEDADKLLAIEILMREQGDM